MDMQRYSRQTLFKDLSKNDQKKLYKSRIAIVGIGATGTVTAALLARAGLGTIILTDRDYIEKSNLQRQTLFNESDIGKAKADIAKERLEKINSDIRILFICTVLNPHKSLPKFLKVKICLFFFCSFFFIIFH